MYGIGSLFNAALHAAWKPTRGIYEGLRGGVKIKNAAGETQKINPLTAQARRIKQNAQTLIHGDPIDFKTGQRQANAIFDNDGNIIDYRQSWLGQHLGNRIGAAAHLVGDLTIGMGASALGWSAKPVLGAAAGVGMWGAKKGARALGHVTYQAATGGASMVYHGAKNLYAMSNHRVGKHVLFGGTVTGMLAYSGGQTMLKDQSVSTLGFMVGQQAEALPGTLASQGIQSAHTVGIDSLGADGDLVLALHHLR